MGTDEDGETGTSRESLYDRDVVHVFEWSNADPHEILRKIRHRISTRSYNNTRNPIEYELTSSNESPLDVTSDVERTGVVDGELTYTGNRTQFYEETVAPTDGHPELIRLVGSAFAGLLTVLITLLGGAAAVIGVGELYFGLSGYTNTLQSTTGLAPGLTPAEVGLTGAVLGVLGLGLAWLAYHLIRHHYDEWDYVTSKRTREWYVEPVATIKIDGEVGETSAYEGEMQSNKSVLSGDFDMIIAEELDIEIEERGEVVDPRDLDDAQSHEIQSALSQVYDPLVFDLDIQEHTKYGDLPNFLHTMG